MKPELSEKLFIEDLFEASVQKLNNKIELDYIDKLTGDASTRRYYRLFTNKESFVACLDHPSEDGFSYFIEIQKFFESYKIRVPKILDSNLERGYILQEDLGDETFLQHISKVKNVTDEYTEYERIVASLIRLHTISSKAMEESRLFDRKFDFEKYMSEIEFTYKFFFEKFLKVEDEKTKKEFLNCYSSICQNLAEQKMVLTHRDFHSRNIMIKGGDRVIIDFQDARLGVPQYDLVSLLEDSYYDISADNKAKLIQYYFENLPQEIHKQGDLYSFYEVYNDMTLQRAIKAIGSFSYIYALRSDVRYVKYIGMTFEKIRKLLLVSQKHEKLRVLLNEHYYQS